MFTIISSLFVGILAVNLTDFENFQIEFSPKCQEYFLFNGSNDKAYFHQQNGKFQMVLTQNVSNYIVYSTKNDSVLLFEWNNASLKINGQILEPVMQEGVLNYPLRFESERFLCDVISLNIGDLHPLECEPLTYKCQPGSNWFLIFVITLTSSVIVILLLLNKDGSHEAVLRSAVSWFTQWGQQILSRSEEATTECDKE